MDDRGKVAELRERLQEAMNDMNMRPIDLSARTGVPKSMMSYYLSGRNEPKADRVHKFAEVLGVNEVWLMGYDVPRTLSAEPQRNDDLANAIAPLSKDPEFFDVVCRLAELPDSEYASIKQLISTLENKKELADQAEKLNVPTDCNVGNDL